MESINASKTLGTEAGEGSQRDLLSPSGESHGVDFADSKHFGQKTTPSAIQLMALNQFCESNPHPTKEQLQELSFAIKLSFQSVSNWLSQQKNDMGGNGDHAAQDPTSSTSGLDSHQAKPSRRNITPYSKIIKTTRPKRSRPEPYQLDALKELFYQTSTPTVEERSALALEIGMDVGKVTNWFRNIRQSSRKRAKKSSENDNDAWHPGASLSSDFTHLHPPESSSDLHDDNSPSYSGPASEDEYEEAVTPPPQSSPVLARPKHNPDPLGADYPRDPSQYPGFDEEQLTVAHALLDFHRRVVD